jgi:hypothetical protein
MLEKMLIFWTGAQVGLLAALWLLSRFHVQINVHPVPRVEP